MKRNILLSVLLFITTTLISLSFCACNNDDFKPQAGNTSTSVGTSDHSSFSSTDNVSQSGGISDDPSISGQDASKSGGQSDSVFDEENNSSSDAQHDLPVGISVYAVKTEYFAGETVSANDLTVELNYDDQTHEKLSAFTIEYQTGDRFVYGDDHFTVVYGTFSEQVQITVSADNLKISDVYNSVIGGYLDAGDTATQISYLLNYSGQEYDKQKINVSWRKISGASSYVFRLSLSEDFSSAITKKSNTYEAFFGTLIPNTEYYAYAEALNNNGEVISRSETCAIKAETKHTVRQVTVEGMTNVRDLGGWSAMGGNVIGYGLIYRGSNLVNITENGKNVLKNELGIKTEIDQRFRSIGHRDVLGALMHLQIDRHSFGDFWIEDDGIYLYTSDSMAGFLCDNLIRISSLSVSFERIDEHPAQTFYTREFEAVITSERADSIVAALAKVSRSEAQRMIRQDKVQLNHRPLVEPDELCDNDCTISIRGAGRFRYLGVVRRTRKDRIVVRFSQDIQGKERGA